MNSRVSRRLQKDCSENLARTICGNLQHLQIIPLVSTYYRASGHALGGSQVTLLNNVSTSGLVQEALMACGCSSSFLLLAQHI